MLSQLTSDQARPPLRAPTSLRQEYQEFLLERIEEYKNSLSRTALLEIGDEAVRELEASAQGQYLLTEVLLLEHVDRVIARRLRLPTFRRWAQKHRALRGAQREPTHWGLAPAHPLVAHAARLTRGDVSLIVGASALAEALFLAAHEIDVFLVDHDLHAVEGAEQRAVTEHLGSRVHALVVRFGRWLPDVLPALVVLDPAALAPARARDRQALLRYLQTRPRPGGSHVVLAPSGGDAARQGLSFAEGALRTWYEQAGWDVERRRGQHRSGGFVARKPARQADTAASVSD
jgi:hypothetical protein